MDTPWLGMHSRETSLNSLLVDKEIEDDGSVIKNVVVRKDFEDGQHLGGWGGATFDVVSESSDGSKCWKITNDSESAFYAKQSAIDMPFEAGKVHHLSFKVLLLVFYVLVFRIHLIIPLVGIILTLVFPQNGRKLIQRLW